MIKVNSAVKIDSQKIARLSHGAIKALEMSAEAVHTKVVPFIPFKIGTLSGEGTFVDYSNSAKGRVSIVSSTPYARRLYYHPEYQFSKVEHPNAQGRWFDAIDKDYASNVFKRFLRQYGGLK